MKYDFKRFDFSKKIKVTYLQCSNLSKMEQEVMSKLSIRVTTMAQFDRFLLLGTVNGELLVI
jgi:hypothetical protein